MKYRGEKNGSALKSDEGGTRETEKQREKEREREKQTGGKNRENLKRSHTRGQSANFSVYVHGRPETVKRELTTARGFRTDVLRKVSRREKRDKEIQREMLKVERSKKENIPMKMLLGCQQQELDNLNVKM